MTVMFEQVQLILFNLLQYRRALQDQARALATWRHNADLCPSVQWRCEQILATIERHRSVVYDTQGPGDAGTDVLIALAGIHRGLFEVGSLRRQTGAR
jgi:hypothetical protein